MPRHYSPEEALKFMQRIPTEESTASDEDSAESGAAMSGEGISKDIPSKSNDEQSPMEVESDNQVIGNVLATAADLGSQEGTDVEQMAVEADPDLVTAAEPEANAPPSDSKNKDSEDDDDIPLALMKMNRKRKAESGDPSGGGSQQDDDENNSEDDMPLSKLRETNRPGSQASGTPEEEEEDSGDDDTDSDDEPLSKIAALNKSQSSPAAKQPKRKSRRKMGLAALPGAPTKPKSAYNTFFGDIQAAVREDNPGIEFRMVTKMVSVKWKALDKNQKAEYQKSAKEAMSVYNVKLAEFAKDTEEKELTVGNSASLPSSSDADASLQLASDTASASDDLLTSSSGSVSIASLPRASPPSADLVQPDSLLSKIMSRNPRSLISLKSGESASGPPSISTSGSAPVATVTSLVSPSGTPHKIVYIKPGNILQSVRIITTSTQGIIRATSPATVVGGGVVQPGVVGLTRPAASFIRAPSPGVHHIPGATAVTGTVDTTTGAVPAARIIRVLAATADGSETFRVINQPDSVELTDLNGTGELEIDTAQLCAHPDCSIPAIEDKRWDGEYCSSTCCIRHGNIIFDNWVAKRRIEFARKEREENEKKQKNGAEAVNV